MPKQIPITLAFSSAILSAVLAKPVVTVFAQAPAVEDKAAEAWPNEAVGFVAQSYGIAGNDENLADELIRRMPNHSHLEGSWINILKANAKSAQQRELQGIAVRVLAQQRSLAAVPALMDKITIAYPTAVVSSNFGDGNILLTFPCVKALVMSGCDGVDAMLRRVGEVNPDHFSNVQMELISYALVKNLQRHDKLYLTGRSQRERSLEVIHGTLRKAIEDEKANKDAENGLLDQLKALVETMDPKPYDFPRRGSGEGGASQALLEAMRG